MAVFICSCAQLAACIGETFPLEPLQRITQRLSEDARAAEPVAAPGPSTSPLVAVTPPSAAAAGDSSWAAAELDVPRAVEMVRARRLSCAQQVHFI